MKSLNSLIITLLPKAEEITSSADAQTLDNLKKSIQSSTRKYITIEEAILNNISYLAIALGKTNQLSANYALYSNIIRYLNGLISTRMNIGLPNINNANELIPSSIRLPVIGKTEIETTTINTNKFKYLTYEKNRLRFDIRAWIREAIDWTIQQDKFYFTTEEFIENPVHESKGYHTYKVNYEGPNNYSYQPYYVDAYNPPRTVYITIDDIISSNSIYLMDLYFYLDGNKFYQINKRRVTTDTDKVSAYFDEIIEETDMTKQRSNRISKIFTNVQNRDIEEHPSTQSFITSIYTDKQIVSGVEEKHKYEKLYKPYCDTTIYHQNDGTKDITYSFTRHDTSIEFNEQKYGIWFERKRTDDETTKISHATTRQVIVTNYEKLLRIDDVEYQLECTRETKTILTTQYPEFKQEITEKINMYKATELETLTDGTTLKGPCNTKTTIIYIDHKDVDIVRDVDVEWTYNVIESLAGDNDDQQVTMLKGEELIIEFENELTQVPGIHFYGYLYQSITE